MELFWICIISDRTFAVTYQTATRQRLIDTFMPRFTDTA